MGLLKCPDCGKEFSDRIDACPNCACPKSAVLKELESKKEVKVNNEIKSEEINPFKYTKKDLMSYEELKIFSIQSILPYICEELKINKADMSECDAQYGVDFIAKTTDSAIGIKFIIDIAPNKSIKLYDEDAAKKMYSLGFKFAVAQIGVGSKDELRFQRRVVLKNDGYLFNYTGLKYFEYKDYSNVRLSLSEDTSWKYIFNPKTDEENPYTIKKEKRTYREYFNSDTYETTIQGLFDKYYIQSRHREFLKEYILSLAESIQYSLSAENTLVNFMNCVDYCQGLFLSNSKAVKENKIILKTIELLEENSFISLNKYELFNFGFYVYYFLKNGGTNAEMISSSLANKMKIDLFKTNSDFFGFGRTVNSEINEKKSIKTISNVSESVFEYSTTDKGNKKSIVKDISILLSIWVPLLYIIICGMIWTDNGFDGTFMDQFFPASFLSLVAGYLVLLIMSNIFKDLPHIWGITAVITFVSTVIIYMLNLINIVYIEMAVIGVICCLMILFKWLGNLK